ncbi:MAG: hypothetical protein OHK0046_22950 [Anaerolineae bacterium]
MFLTLITQAQPPPPLIGPLVATTAAEQDRLLIYDLGAPEGTAKRELSFGAGQHHMWGFSPEGCRVLFTLDEAGNGLPKLYSANLDGSDVRAMVEYDELPADDWGVWEPNWSARGLIAFTMIRNEDDGEQAHHIGWIYGTGGEPQFYSVTGREFTPIWSADGEWLAYVSYDERPAGADIQSTAVPTPEGQPAAELPTVQEADIWLVSADGETKYRLTNFSTGSVRAPRWSPDGDLIGFVYSPSPSNDTFWMIGAQQGANPTQLSYFWNLTLDFTWLPDSTAMLAAVRDFRSTSQNRLWQIPLVGNADDNATVYLQNPAYTYTDYPRFSADGRYLAFRSDYGLHVLEVSTGQVTRLDPTVLGNMPPVWSPELFAGEAVCG